MKLTKIALILILSPFIFLAGCSSLPVEETINPNALPPEDLATVLGHEDFHSTKTYISNVMKIGHEEKLFKEDQYLKKLTLEPSKYTFNTYCHTSYGGYARPDIHVNLQANKTYRIECGYCVAKGQKDWWRFMKSGRPIILTTLDFVLLPNTETASFKEILNAAKAGYGKARLAVANTYYDGTYPKGEEVSNNLHEAYAWAYLADALREPDADLLLSKITAEIDDLDAAESLANKYLLEYHWASRSPLCSKPMVSDSDLSENLEAKTENRKIKVILYSNDSGFGKVRTAVEIKINGLFVKNLLLNEYVEVFLSPGTHNLDLRAWYSALSIYKGNYDLNLGDEALIIKINEGFSSMKYEIMDELPANFREKYIRAKM